MTADAEVRAVSRDLAALPHAERKVSLLLHRLENALKRAGLLGDPARLRELGMTLREAGLTVDGKIEAEGEGFFVSCPTREEREKIEAGHRDMVEGLRKKWDEERPNFVRDWVSEIEWGEEVRHPGWHAWDPPPIGAHVVECFKERRYAQPSVVSGAVCEALVRREVHKNCRTCDCFELKWMLGGWVFDSYHGASGSFKPSPGPERDEDGFCVLAQAQYPHNLRPWMGPRVPSEILRPRVRAHLAREAGRESFEARKSLSSKK